MKKSILCLSLFIGSILSSCIFDIRVEPSTRWNSPMDMAMRVPSFSLLRGQILILHLPLENNHNRWKIPQSGTNESIQWYSEANPANVELRIKALKSGSYVFPLPFQYGTETARVIVTLSIDQKGITPDLNPLFLTLAENHQSFENHPQSPVVIRLENPNAHEGIWRCISTKKIEMPVSSKSYPKGKSVETEFTFDASFESRTLRFEFFEKGHKNSSSKAVYTITPMKDIPTC